MANAQEIPDRLYYRIGEVSAITEVAPYVLRYWESEFKLLRPKKNSAGQRVYQKRDVELVLRIKALLYGERLTLEGAKKRLLAEARRRGEQLELGVNEPLGETLRRVKRRLEALRQQLASDGKGRPSPRSANGGKPWL